MVIIILITLAFLCVFVPRINVAQLIMFTIPTMLMICAALSRLS